MLTRILPLLMGVLGIGSGVAVGLLLAPPPAPAPPGAADGAPAADRETGGDDAGREAGHDYVRLTNQFVVPVVEQERIAAMVVLSLSLEVRAGTQDKVYALEPKLRDGFLRVLFDHANMGGFGGRFTDAEMLDVLRGNLRDAARRDLGDAVRSVLIVDIARQDV